MGKRQLADFQLRADLTNGGQELFGIEGVQEAKEMLLAIRTAEPEKYKGTGDLYPQTPEAKKIIATRPKIRNACIGFLALSYHNGQWDIVDGVAVQGRKGKRYKVIRSYYTTSKDTR